MSLSPKVEAPVFSFSAEWAATQPPSAPATPAPQAAETPAAPAKKEPQRFTFSDFDIARSQWRSDMRWNWAPYGKGGVKLMKGADLYKKFPEIREGKKEEKKS